MLSKGVSFIFPVLNEKDDIILKTIKIAKDVCKKRGLNYQIFLCDGGSKLKNLIALKRKVSSIENIKLLMDFPIIRPNKDIAIMNAIKFCKYENIIISDVDIINISQNHFESLINHLLKNIQFVIPNLNRVGGRWNRLLGNPFMRLFFEEEYKKVPYPAPGILGIKKTILESIVKKDFYYDWGGEIQIAITGAKLSKRVSAPLLHKIDSKKRPIKDMVKDAFQVWRTNLYLIKKYKKRANLNNYRKKYEKEHELLDNFIQENKISLKYFFNKDYLNLLEKSYKNNPKNIYNLIEKIYLDTKLYEFKVINYLVTKPLLFLLFGIKIKDDFIEKEQSQIRKLNFKYLSIFIDYIVYFLIKKSKRLCKFNFKKTLGLLDQTRTEFISEKLVKLSGRNKNQGLILDNYRNDQLEIISRIINEKNVFVRNKKLLNFFNEDLIGSINGQKITFSELKYKEKNIGLDKHDVFVRTSIMTTIAGYLKQNRISVNHKYKNNKKPFEKFLSYMLNNKKFAPMDYDVKIDFNGTIKEKQKLSNNYDCIILFSGGVDSTAALLLALDFKMNPLILWIGFGQKNQDKEFSVVKKVSKKINRKLAIVKIDLSKYIEKGWKEWDYIIPARNFIFVSIAANILSNSTNKKGYIFLSAHEEEIKPSNTDKSIRFFRTCTKLFSEYYHKDINVTTPFAKVTKAEILCFWKKKWIEKFKITPYDTITCYYGNNCGECKACYKRNFALVAAGLVTDTDLKKDVFLDKMGFIKNDFIARMDDFPRKRKYEYLIALQAKKENVPSYIRSYLDSLSKKEILLIHKRSEEIKKANLGDVKWI